MPTRFFYCPDGKTIETEKCLQHCSNRCLSLSTLTRLSRDREWTGKPSTTMLINGTRHELLKIAWDYPINPRRKGFALAGERLHFWQDKMVESAKLNVLSEETLTRRTHTGRSDTLEELPGDKDWYVLIDYKLWGSYKVAKAMGLVRDGKTPDPSGALYKSSGKWGKAGTPKMIDRWAIKSELASAHELELQMSDYAEGWEELGFNIYKMMAQITIRDANTLNAVRNGFPKHSDDTFMIPVKRLPSQEIKAYFQNKSAALLEALARFKESGVLPPMCTEEERWDGIRCKDYCDVVDFCPEGLQIKTGEGQVDDE